MRGINRRKKDEVMEECWTELNNEKCHNVHSSPNIIIIITMIKSRWTRHAPRMRRNEYRILAGNPRQEITSGKKIVVNVK